MGGAMSRQCHTPASSRHAHAAPLKEGAVPGSGGVSRRRVMLVDGVGRGRTAPLPPPSSRQTSMEERRLLHYLYSLSLLSALFLHRVYTYVHSLNLVNFWLRQELKESQSVSVPSVTFCLEHSIHHLSFSGLIKLSHS